MNQDRRPIPSVAETYRRLTGLDPHATGKRVTNDEIAVRCVSTPNHAHGDRSPSLHINRSKDTWVCRTCAAQGVLGGRSIELVIHAGRARDEKEALDFLLPREDQKPKLPPPPPDQQRLAAEYNYRDASGKVLYQVRRFEWDLPDGGTDKTFSQRRRLENGAWEARLGDVERVPYCYPEMVEAMALGSTVYVVEGEKCAEILRTLGLCATTNAGGSAWKWTLEFVEFFRAATTVIVLGDNDDPGRAAARSRADMLANVCGSVRLLESLPGVTEKGGDVADWLDINGHDVTALRKMIFQHALMVGAKLDDGSMTALHIWPLHQRILATQTAPLPGVQFGIDALDKELLGMHPGEVTILAARTNVGKTALAEKIAMGGSRTHKVLFYSLEMGAIRIHDRIAARCHGMKPKEYVRQGRPVLPDDVEWFNLHKLLIVGKCSDATVERMEELIALHQPALVVIDHLRHVKGWLGGGKRADLAASKVMYDLVNMASRRQTHLLLLHQLGRDADGSRPVLSDLRDAGAVEETADNVLLLHRPFQHKHREVGLDAEFADDICEISLQKARDGGTFTTHLLWDGANMEFRNPWSDEERLHATRCCTGGMPSGDAGRRRR